LSGVRYFAFAKNIVVLIADRYLFCIFSSLLFTSLQRP